MQSLPVRQIAYFVPDIRAAALAHHRDFGSGPFLVAEHIPLRLCTHRGVPAALDHSAAYGQWGAVMVEFIQQNNPGPSAFHDMYPRQSGRGGLHHVAVFTGDLPAAMADYEAAGHTAALYAEMETGFAFAMMDTSAHYGHMVELYQPEPVLLDFYAMVSAVAGDLHAGLLRDIRLG
jgi:hypothetical protein